MTELDEYALSRRHTKVDCFPVLRPFTVAVVVVALRWPDRGLPMCLVEGFDLADDIEASQLFRPIEERSLGKPVPLRPNEQLFGEDAAQFVDELVADGSLGELTRQIYDLTVEEAQAGLAVSLRDRRHFDEHYGRGQWRPLPRHCIWQGEKWRPIDDGRRARTNAMASVHEAMVCAPGELLLMIVRALAAALIAALGQLPPWFMIRMFVEDWLKGYRQLMPSLRDRALTVAALVHPDSGEWLLTQLNGLPFGLGTAVNQFGRAASLMTAVARRWLCILCGNYVDDTGAVELACLAYRTQQVFIAMAEVLGVSLSPTKWRLPGGMGNFLGHLHDFTRLATDRAMGFGPKLGLRTKIAELIHRALVSGFLSAAQASKLRGRLTWLDTNLSGRVCRGAMSALIARQYYELASEITVNLDSALRFLVAVVEHQPDRAVPLCLAPARPVVVYTDASDERGQVRVGALVFDDEGIGHILVHDVPSAGRSGERIQ